MKPTTYIKFMTKEELVNMLIQIKNFKNPITKKHHHKYKTCEENWSDRWNRAKYRFNMNNLDFVDALIYENGGYVRYHGACEEVFEMLRIEFGFREE